MKSWIRMIVVPLLALFGATCFSENVALARPIVFVSIAPQAWLVEQIAGDFVDVHTLLPASAGHAQYEPRPSQLRALSRAQLYCRIGLPFEEHIWDRLRAMNPTMDVVDARVVAAVLHEGHEHGGDDHHGADPHIWLDPTNAAAHAWQIADALAVRFPEHKTVFRERLFRLTKMIQSTEKEIHELLDAKKGQTFWVYHASWTYYAEVFGVEQAVLEYETKSVGSRSFARWIDAIREASATTLFVEPQLSPSTVAVLETEAGVSVAVLDPMAYSYCDNLLSVTRAIVESMR